MIKGMEERNIDHEALLDTYIQAYNDCLKGHPQDMTIGLHHNGSHLQFVQCVPEVSIG